MMDDNQFIDKYSSLEERTKRAKGITEIKLICSEIYWVMNQTENLCPAKLRYRFIKRQKEFKNYESLNETPILYNILDAYNCVLERILRYNKYEKNLNYKR